MGTGTVTTFKELIHAENPPDQHSRSRGLLSLRIRDWRWPGRNLVPGTNGFCRMEMGWHSCADYLSQQRTKTSGRGRRTCYGENSLNFMHSQIFSLTEPCWTEKFYVLRMSGRYRLMPRLASAEKITKKILQEVPVALIAYDLLELNGNRYSQTATGIPRQALEDIGIKAQLRFLHSGCRDCSTSKRGTI